jgi:hypothetical protein
MMAKALLEGSAGVPPALEFGLFKASESGRFPSPAQRADEWTHLGSVKGAAIPQPSPQGREHGFVMVCGLKGGDIMPFGHHKPRTGRIAGLQPALSSYPCTQPWRTGLLNFGPLGQPDRRKKCVCSSGRLPGLLDFCTGGALEMSKLQRGRPARFFQLAGKMPRLIWLAIIGEAPGLF